MSKPTFMTYQGILRIFMDREWFDLSMTTLFTTSPRYIYITWIFMGNEQSNFAFKPTFTTSLDIPRIFMDSEQLGSTSKPTYMTFQDIQGRYSVLYPRKPLGYFRIFLGCPFMEASLVLCLRQPSGQYRIFLVIIPISMHSKQSPYNML